MRGTNNPAAFEAYLEGERLFSIISKTDMAQSRRKFEEAVELDGNFARAYGYLSYTYARSVLAGWDSQDSIVKAIELAKKAVYLDPNDYAPHWDLGFAYLNNRQFAMAKKEYERALDLYTNWTDLLDRKHGLLAEMAEAYIYMGETEQAIALLKRAQRVPDWYRWNLGWAYYNAKEYDLAIEELCKMTLKPGDPGYVMDVQLFVAAAYAQKGNLTMAKAALALFTDSIGGRYTINQARKRGCFKSTTQEAHWLDGLRKAGLPEQ